MGPKNFRERVNKALIEHINQSLISMALLLITFFDCQLNKEINESLQYTNLNSI